ncbi:MAG: ABC transporter permease [Phycisphaerae bacterium]|jgi:phospholipid/cholesterol/gamma-HCH transport system permease protein
MSGAAPPSTGGPLVAFVTAVGRAGLGVGSVLAEAVRYLGHSAWLVGDACVWLARSLITRRVRMNWSALAFQMVRVGVRSIPIILLVQVFIGIILTLQMAPTLASYGSLDRVANIVAIAMFRELGPLLSAIVLSGFAGASIAAEIGAMVEAEEIKALRAHALDPVRFLVLPRLLATVVMLVGLAVMADVVGVGGGLMTAWWVLDIHPNTYLENTRVALLYSDFVTGLVKAGVFGLLIAVIACHEGLSVSGGAEGVGRATTATVVRSIVALIATDCLFTAAFYLFGL